MGIVVSESLGTDPLMRYYVVRRVSASTDELVISTLREIYDLYARILHSGGTDVAAPAAQ